MRNRLAALAPAVDSFRSYAGIRGECFLRHAEPAKRRGELIVRHGSAKIFDGDEQPDADHGYAAEPHHHCVNATVELFEPQIEPLFHRV